MLVSFIILTYNSDETIEKSINSIIFSNIDSLEYEIIIIDDGSNDDTINIINRYIEKYNNIKLLFSNDNKENICNLPISRNIGMKNSNGKYVRFLDSDDYFNSMSLIKDFHYLRSNIEDSDIIITNAITRRYNNLITNKNYRDFIFDGFRNFYVKNKMIKEKNILCSEDKYYHYSEDEFFFSLIFDRSKSIGFINNEFTYYCIKRISSHSDLNSLEYNKLLKLIDYCDNMKIDLLNIVKKEESKILVNKLVDDSISKIIYQMSIIFKNMI